MSGSDESKIRLWRASDGELLINYDQETQWVVTQAVFSPDGTRFAYGRLDATVVMARNPFALPFTVYFVAPNRALTNADISAAIYGSGFVEGSSVRLTKQNAPDIAPASPPLVISSFRMQADFRFVNAVPGRYNVVVTRPEGISATFPNAFEIVDEENEQPDFSAGIAIPTQVRPNREYIGTLNFRNGGEALVAMDAPLLIVRSQQNVPIRLSPKDPWSRTLFVLASGADGRQLRPGEWNFVPFHFLAPDLPGGTRLRFMVEQVADIRPEAFADSWAAIEQQVRPAEIDPVAWVHIWSAFIAQLGSDSTAFHNALRDASAYLAANGEVTVDATRLLSIAARQAFGMLAPQSALASDIDAAMPAPGLPLLFGRIAPMSLDARFRTGIFGRGWTHSYDIRVREQNGDILVRYPNNAERRFSPDRTGWKPFPGDHGKMTRDANGYTLQETDGTTLQFNVAGVLLSLTDTNANRLTLEYQDGQLARIVHSSGQSLTLTYAGGALWNVTDSFGRTTQYGYTGASLTSVTHPGGRVIQYAYYAADAGARAHALRTITNPDSTVVNYEYDNLGRLTQQAGVNGVGRVTYGYPGQGRVQAQNAVGFTAEMSRGAQGLPLKTQSPAGTLRVQYDIESNPLRVIAPDGLPWDAAFDDRGNTTAAANPLGASIQMGYTTDLNQLDWLRDSNNGLMDFTLDNRGNLESIRHQDSSEERAEYDANGNVRAIVNRRGQRIDFEHNANGQVVRKVAGNRVTMYGYDGHGNLERITDSLSGEIVMQYDARDFLRRIAYPNGKWFEYDYDNAGKRTARRSSDGPTLTYGYEAGRLHTITSSDGSVGVTYAYDNANQLKRETRGNGAYTTYDYEKGRLKEIGHYSPTGVVQSRFAYTYDANGFPETMTTLNGTWQYKHDAAGQLYRITAPNGTVSVAQYDGEGNRIRVIEGSVTTPYVTNNLNQYTLAGNASFTYDHDGNVKTRTDASGITTYDYDVENRLIKVITPSGDVWEYGYDGQGNRTTVTRNGVTTHYIFEGDSVAAEYAANGTLTARYTYGAGLLARTDGGGSAYYGFDLTGNTRQMTNGAGAVVNAYEYTPFGSVLPLSEAVPNAFRYVGRYGVMQEGHGLHFMRARYYDPSTGRFISPDPISLSGGDTNLYKYVANSPIVFVDPSGNIIVVAPWIVAAGAGALSNVAIYAVEAAISSDVDFTASGVLGAAATGAALGPIFGKAATLIRRAVPKSALSRLTRWDYKPLILGKDDKHYKILGKLHLGTATNAPGLSGWHAGGASWHAYLTHLNVFYGTFWQYSNGFNLGNAWLAVLAALDYWLFRIVCVGDTEIVRPIDPNEKRGPVGQGPLNALPNSDGSYTYTVYFENVPTAGTAAQEVFVTDFLDPDLDYSTLELGEIVFGNQTIADFSGYQYGLLRVPLNETPYVVDIAVMFNPVTGRLDWIFRTIDPLTNDLPEDALAGFLPPNDISGRGEGHVSFTIRPRVSSFSRTVQNRATIVFDTEQSITTNTWSNIIDPVAPSSQVLPLPEVSSTLHFLVRWSGSDDPGGAGIQDYDVFVSDNNGAWTAWLSNTTDTSATYPGQFGHTYRFYSVARDWAGNEETAPAVPDAVTSLGSIVSGTVTLEDCVNMAQSVQFVFRSEKRRSDLVITTTLAPNGAFSLSGIPPADYRVAVKGTKWLQKVVAVNTSAGHVSGVQIALPGGDANNDNQVDVDDLALLIRAFDATPADTNWIEGADFNCNEIVEVDDLAILVRNFDKSGDE